MDTVAVVRPLTLEPSTTEVLRVSSETRREAASPPAQSVRLQCTPDALPSWRPALVVDAWRALEHSLAMVQQEAEDARYADGLRQRAVRLHRDDLVQQLDAFEDHLRCRQAVLRRSIGDLGTLLTVAEWADASSETHDLADRYLGLLVERLLPIIEWSERPLLREHPCGGWLRSVERVEGQTFTVVAESLAGLPPVDAPSTSDGHASYELRSVEAECEREWLAFRDADLLAALLHVVETTVVSADADADIAVADGMAHHATQLTRLIQLHAHLPEARQAALVADVRGAWLDA